MRWADIITLSLLSFKNRTSRMILTTLGVAIGIAVVMFLVSIGYGLQRTILNRITTSEALLTLDITSPDQISVPLTNKIVDDIKKIKNVRDVSPRSVYTGRISLGTINSEARIYAVHANYFNLSGLALESGTFFSSEDKNKIIVTTTTANLLGKEGEDIIGETINLTITSPQDFSGEDLTGNQDALLKSFQKRATIVGVLQDTQIDNDIYMLHSDIDPLLVQDYESIKAQVDNQNNLEEVRVTLVEQGYIVSSVSDLVRQANRVFSTLQFILGIFGVFSLIVAAIGLLNTMTISLLERTNEIGIMRALGATRFDIQKLFLIESSMIGFFGGVIGLVLGFSAGVIFNIVLNIITRALGGDAVSIFYTPPWFVIAVIASSVGVGFISGFFPAKKASNLNTLTALRYK